MSRVPDEIQELVARREEARLARDFATADALRDRIRRSGFEVTDTEEGPVVVAAAGTRASAPAAAESRPEDIVSLLDQSPSFDASVQWVVEGWPEDVIRGIASFNRHCARWNLQHVIVDQAGADRSSWPVEADVIRLASEVGWAAGRNVGLRRALGRIVLVIDGSVEAEGDVVDPLIAALADPSVGLTGPFGIVTDDLREFRPAPGPECDAVEGYLMAFRRDLVEDGLRFDEKFKFYRTADIELSFQIKSQGLRATVAPVPVTRHEHRRWANTSEEERARFSKRNFYRFLDRWRGRTDLTVAGRKGGP